MPYIFGASKGHLPNRTCERAAELGADAINYTDAQDHCGYGCKPYTCPKSKRHWFTLDEGNTARSQGTAIIEQLTREGLLPKEAK